MGEDPLAALCAAAGALRSLKVVGRFGEGAAAAAAIRRLPALTRLSLAMPPCRKADLLEPAFDRGAVRMAAVYTMLPLHAVASAARPAGIRWRLALSRAASPSLSILCSPYFVHPATRLAAQCRPHTYLQFSRVPCCCRATPARCVMYHSPSASWCHATCRCLLLHDVTLSEECLGTAFAGLPVLRVRQCAMHTCM